MKRIVSLGLLGALAGCDPGNCPTPEPLPSGVFLSTRECGDPRSVGPITMRVDREASKVTIEYEVEREGRLVRVVETWGIDP